MGRCCDGKNAYKPITFSRYLAGVAIFFTFHVYFIILFLITRMSRKNDPNLLTIWALYRSYFYKTSLCIFKRDKITIK